MRGPVGCAMVMAVVLASGGCARDARTPAEKTQARLEKQQAAETRAAQQRAARDRRRAHEQALAEQRQAEQHARREQRERAVEEQHRRHDLAQATPQPQEPISFQAQQFPDIYPDDRLNVIGYPYIDPENNPRLSDAHVRAAAAAGAREDAMLGDDHFSGGKLNALGRGKLTLMMHNAPRDGSAVSIWLVRSGADEHMQARRAAVEQFWKQSQYAAVPTRIQEGANPGTSVPAGPGITALQRLNRPGPGQDATSSGGETTGGRSRIGAGLSQGGSQ